MGQPYTIHNTGKWSGKPPREKNPTFMLYTHIIICERRGFRLENENHCNSSMQGSRFLQQLFRVGKSEKQYYVY